MVPTRPAGDVTTSAEVTTPAPDSSGTDAGSSPRLTDAEAAGVVAVAVGDAVPVGDADAVGDGDGDGVGDFEAVGDFEGVGFTDALGDAFVLGLTTTAG